MMYSDKFVLAIKCNGQILREDKDTVYLPFGSEYVIYLKNLETRRAKVRVWIDGTEATDGIDLVVSPGQAIDLERSIRNGNLTAGNKFKFIERIAEIEQHRGIGGEDGLVRIEWAFEKPRPKWTSSFRRRDRIGEDYLYESMGRECCDYEPTKFVPCSNDVKLSGTINTSYTGDTIQNYYCETGSTTTLDFAPITKSAPINEAGITAEGSISNQRFIDVADFEVDPDKHSMVIRLLGKTGELEVVQPVVVKTKVQCTMCGKKTKPPAKFCANCGAGLVIV